MSEDSTKTNLLKAATSIFGRHGYSGGSVRQIADAANTNIGAIKYHYGSKEDLWKEVVTRLFEDLGAQILQDAPSWVTMGPRDRVINSTGNYIRFCARHPELNRIILSETIENGSRMQWLAENHFKLFIEQSADWMVLAQEAGIYPRDVATLNLVFIAMSVSQYLFLMAPFIQHAFGIDVSDDAEIEKHIDAVLKVVLSEVGPPA